MEKETVIAFYDLCYISYSANYDPIKERNIHASATVNYNTCALRYLTRLMIPSTLLIHNCIADPGNCKYRAINGEFPINRAHKSTRH